MLKGVIFDVDGTLVDSNDAHAKSWVETFAEAGYDVPFPVVRPLVGMGGDKLLPRTIGVGLRLNVNQNRRYRAATPDRTNTRGPPANRPDDPATGTVAERSSPAVPTD